MGESNLEAMDREKRSVAFSSVVGAVLLTVTKLIVGFNTNSLGILSEAAHSGLDLVAAGVTLWAVRVAGIPADHRHTYGHGKVENLSALFETLLLLATCGWIAYEAVERLTSHEAPVVNASVWAFGVVLLSMVVDISRSRALMRVARKYDSQALEADALHFSTDIWSSGVVLVGLVAVKLAEPLGLPWLHSADAMAALGVAGIVLVVSLRLARRTVDDLLDAVAPEMVDNVRAAAGVQGVIGVGEARVRRSGSDCYADVTVFVASNLEVSAAHEIADAVERAVGDAVPRVRTMVHVEPWKGETATKRALGGSTMTVVDEAKAASRNLVWDVPVRLAHVLLVGGFVAAFAIAELSDDDGPLFSLHMVFGLLVLAVALFRVVWGVVGTRYARFNSFEWGRAALAAYLAGIFTGRGPRDVGHNPATSYATAAILLLALGIGASGLLTTVGMGESLEDVHEVLVFALLGISIVHVVGVLLDTLRHRDDIVLSMVDGKKAIANANDAARPAWGAGIVVVGLASGVLGLGLAGYSPRSGSIVIPGIGWSLHESEDHDEEHEGHEPKRRHEEHDHD